MQDDQHLNGHDLSEEEENAARDIRRIQAREPLPVVEPVSPLPPFEQKSHTLLLESLDRLAQDWLTELASLRNNTQVVEQMVLQTCAKAKDDITKMHLLGAQVRQEVRRGEDVLHHIEEQLDQILEQRVA